jgi:hypothetical protein
MGTGRQVHALLFADAHRLARAFEQLVQSDWIDDRLVELEALRIRSVAAVEAARPLVERIDLEGGLRFASRHRSRLLRDPRSPTGRSGPG